MTEPLMKSNYYRNFLRAVPVVLLFVIAASNAFAYLSTADSATAGARIPESVSSAVSELRSDIDRIIDVPEFSNALIGVSVQNVADGKVIYARNENRNFIPASNQKLMTTAAALKVLGPDFKFTTSLYLDGEIKNGVFTGNVVIRGGGDPSISPIFGENPSEFLDKWVKVLASKGIKSIDGNIIGDGRYFDKVPYCQGWGWDDFVFPFSAPVSALSINDNRIDIIIKPSANAGETPVYTMRPAGMDIRIDNKIKTVGEDKVTEIIPSRDPMTGIIELNGKIAKDSLGKESVTSVSVDNPVLFFTAMFKQALDKAGIELRGALLDIDNCTEKINYSKMKPVAERVSPPLKEIVNYINKNSHNLASEMILKAMGKEVTGTGSTYRGLVQVKKFVTDCGLRTDAMYIADGSGLSRFNLCSPKNLTTLLNKIYASDSKDDFMNSLAEPGKNGTLKRRMTKSLAETAVKAKTGSLNGVSCLTGYVKSRSGELLSFSVMIQNQTVPDSVAQNLQDMICMRLAAADIDK